MKPKTIKIPDLVATALLGLLNRNTTALHLEVATADTKTGRKRNQSAQTAFRLGRRGALLDLARELGLALPEAALDPLALMRVGTTAGPFELADATRDASKYNPANNIPLPA